VFKVYDVAEGGLNLFGSDTKTLGELNIYPKSFLITKVGCRRVPMHAILLGEIAFRQ
jgi:hypothetical protein